MFAVHATVTVLAALLTGLAAVGNFLGHEYVREQARKMRVPSSWRWPLGALLAAGALGLLAGFALPWLGLLAAAGLVLYFVGAFFAHLRVRDFQLGPWAAFFTLVVGALVTNLLYY